jgi:hypothetical protein
MLCLQQHCCHRCNKSLQIRGSAGADPLLDARSGCPRWCNPLLLWPCCFSYGDIAQACLQLPWQVLYCTVVAVYVLPAMLLPQTRQLAPASNATFAHQSKQQGGRGLHAVQVAALKLLAGQSSPRPPPSRPPPRPP